MAPIRIPPLLATSIEGWEDDTASKWLPELSNRLERLSDLWDIEILAPFEPGGVTAWVAPVRQADGGHAVAKVVIPHREARHEAAALTAWGGEGAVELLAHAPDEDAMLIERCRPGTPLTLLGDPDAIIDAGARVLRQTWVPAPDGHPFESLAEVAGWFADLVAERQARLGEPLPQDLVDTALELLRTLPTTATRQVVLHHDLHPGNVLLHQRGWLAIDPKPQVGDPAFDPVQLVLQSGEVLDELDPLDVVRGRVERLADLLDLGPGRLAGWGLARCVEWALYDIDSGRPDDGARHAQRAALFAPLVRL
ncbi:MAG: phosphotransferase [Acidimicrobiia bacterium]|nr:phosphotransferase [Acidimicrobiia bacterium]